MAANVVIVGAGPYGLSIAAHLRAAGIDFRIFGVPMRTWREAMPEGMNLKSDGFASSLSAVKAGSELRDFCRARGVPYDDTAMPIPLAAFIDYALDFQANHVPDLDPREISSIEADGQLFHLELEDGERLVAKRVIIAAGIAHFANLPSIFATVPAEFASHSSGHREMSRFAGRDVAIVGAGASAINLAVLMAEAQVRPTLIARAPAIHFAGVGGASRRSLWQRMRHPSSGLGSSLRSWLCCTIPDVFRLLPAKVRLAILRRHLGPSSPGYQRARLEGRVPCLLGHDVVGCDIVDGRVSLRLLGPDAVPTTITVDHVIAATGYRAGIDRLTFLSPALRNRIRTASGYPVLSATFESSMPGLHFVGLAAAGSFGPLLRFTYGAGFTAKRLVSALG